MADVVFGAIDLFMERVRRSHLVAVLVAGAVAWLVFGSAILALFVVGGSAIFGVLLLIAPTAILVATAIWGLDAVPWPAWSVGVGPIVFIAAVVAPQIDHHAKSAVVRLTVGVFVFVYAQVYLSTVVSMDELHKRRTVAVGDHEPVARRVAQLKLLVAIIILAMSLVNDPTDSNPPTSTNAWPIAFAVSLLFGGFALFVRGRRTAWTAAAVIGVTFALTVASIDASHRIDFLTANLWICLTTCYLFAKAGNRQLWPSG